MQASDHRQQVFTGCRNPTDDRTIDGDPQIIGIHRVQDGKWSGMGIRIRSPGTNGVPREEPRVVGM